jgi:hypothetical protein
MAKWPRAWCWNSQAADVNCLRSGRPARPHTRAIGLLGVTSRKGPLRTLRRRDARWCRVYLKSRGHDMVFSGHDHRHLGS